MTSLWCAHKGSAVCAPRAEGTHRSHRSAPGGEACWSPPCLTPTTSGAIALVADAWWLPFVAVLSSLPPFVSSFHTRCISAGLKPTNMQKKKRVWFYVDGVLYVFLLEWLNCAAGVSAVINRCCSQNKVRGSISKPDDDLERGQEKTPLVPGFAGAAAAAGAGGAAGRGAAVLGAGARRERESKTFTGHEQITLTFHLAAHCPSVVITTCVTMN